MNMPLISGVDRGVAGVAGVAEATLIIQFLFNKFGQKIRAKRYCIYCGLHQFQNPTYLPGYGCMELDFFYSPNF